MVVFIFLITFPLLILLRSAPQHQEPAHAELRALGGSPIAVVAFFCRSR